MAAITFPPLMEEDADKPRNWLHLQFSDGEVTITIQSEGAGAYISIQTDVNVWTLDPEELMAFAHWANEMCQTMDSQE